jgi:hypothetical protein
MKQLKRLILAGAISVAFVSSSGVAFADQQPKLNATKRPTSKPSVFQTWRSEMRAQVQEIRDYSKYIQGSGPPRY